MAAPPAWSVPSSTLPVWATASPPATRTACECASSASRPFSHAANEAATAVEIGSVPAGEHPAPPPASAAHCCKPCPSPERAWGSASRCCMGRADSLYALPVMDWIAEAA